MVSFKLMVVCALLLVSLIGPSCARVFLLDDGAPAEELVAEETDPAEARVRRDGGGHGVTGPVHTFVKTDKHAHFKWGVRHHVGHHYAG